MLGYLFARGVKDRREREAALERLLDHVESEDRLVFGSPQATVRAIDMYEQERPRDAAPSDDDATDARRAWLPTARPKAMPRQPLGDLPAVLRGSFWSRTARWAWPRWSRAPQASTAPAADSQVP